MNTENLPIVTIITPVYNGARFLEELIQSVQEQSYPHIEHIIIDDGSDDDGASVAILERHPHLRWWSRENRGQYATMNEGLVAARGDLICFINADDLCAQGAVQLVVDYLITHPEADGVYGKKHYIDENGRSWPVQMPQSKLTLKWYRYYARISHCSLYIRKSAIEEKSLWLDGDLRFQGDHDWILRIIQSKLQIGFLNQILSEVRVHSGQATQRFRNSMSEERSRVLKRHRINRHIFSVVQAASTILSACLHLMYELRTNGPKGMLILLGKWLRRRFIRGRIM